MKEQPPPNKAEKPDKPLNKDIVKSVSRAILKYLLGAKLRYDSSSSMLALKLLSQLLKVAGLVCSVDRILDVDDVFGLISLVVGKKKTAPVVNGAEGATGFVESSADEWYRHAVTCFFEELLTGNFYD